MAGRKRSPGPRNGCYNVAIRSGLDRDPDAYAKGTGMDEQERRRREDRSAYLNELLRRTDEDWNEDMMHVLLDQRVSANINEDKDEKKTFGQKAADAAKATE